eukprot:834900-Amphidinium_carterae.1
MSERRRLIRSSQGWLIGSIATTGELGSLISIKIESSSDHCSDLSTIPVGAYAADRKGNAHWLRYVQLCF